MMISSISDKRHSFRSVRFLLSSTGAITDTYDYDAFGNLIFQAGTTPNNYLFAGEQFDPVLGIYYNRARYYDQRQGRFWSMDRYEGRSEDPTTLHKYAYTGNEPVNRRDPSGRDFDLATTLNNLQVQATLFVQNTAARFAVAFAAGGTALGRFYNQLGAVAENIATEVVELLEIANPETIQSVERDVEELEEGGGQRFIDIAIRTSDKIKDILIEVKYKIPTDGEALTRLIGQVNAALRSGNEVIVWALKPPTAAELENLAEELGANASRIQVLSGVENLYNYIQSLLK
jgi:RHS repeat-associated protein